MSARTTNESKTSGCACQAEIAVKTKEVPSDGSPAVPEKHSAAPAADGSQKAVGSIGQEGSETAATGGIAQECASAFAREIRQLAGETGGLKELGEQATELIRRYPVQAVLIGMGVGFLFARTRRS